MKKLNGVSFSDVNITGGFWKEKQDLNRNVTAKAVYDRFSETHRFDALKCIETDEYSPHIYWDSDIAKWIEGVAYIIKKAPSPELEALADKAISNIISAQGDDGYFNSYYLVKDTDKRFTYRGNHELYCAGHLFEAAVAYYESTGKREFLDAMCRYADYIYDRFVVKKDTAFVTGGHPEIELALVRLADASGNNKYLELSKFFLDNRGINTVEEPTFADWDKANYSQSDIPLKQKPVAEGHCVRALYIYSAMADIAEKYNDNEYFDVCKKLFDDIMNNKMYITGGIGSTYVGEAFTIPYHLPNATAYTETCAAISLALYCQRMQNLDIDSKYADVAERVIYNGFLSGISLDGKSFFYENPLEIDPELNDIFTSTKSVHHTPITERVEVFECSCCPPNDVRFTSSIANLFYSYNEEAIYVHQFAESSCEIQKTKISQKTDYPTSGSIKFNIENSTFKYIAVRIPAWCQKFKISKPYKLENGYAYIECFENDTIDVEFNMPVVMLEANEKVHDCAGKVAIARGPVIYCVEEKDNGKHIKNLFIDKAPKFILGDKENFMLPTIVTPGYRRVTGNSLYSTLMGNYQKTDIKFIPYYAFANRGKSEMTVWVNKKF